MILLSISPTEFATILLYTLLQIMSYLHIQFKLSSVSGYLSACCAPSGRATCACMKYVACARARNGFPRSHSQQCSRLFSINSQRTSVQSPLSKTTKKLTVHRMLSELTDVPITSICNDLRQLSQVRRNVNLRHLDQLRQFVVLLHNEPETAIEAWRSGVVPILVELKTCGQAEIEMQARMALSLLGYSPPYAGRGLRILSIDGGGTR